MVETIWVKEDKTGRPRKDNVPLVGLGLTIFLFRNYDICLLLIIEVHLLTKRHLNKVTKMNKHSRYSVHTIIIVTLTQSKPLSESIVASLCHYSYLLQYSTD